jgi:primary-amine oxidase
MVFLVGFRCSCFYPSANFTLFSESNVVGTMVADRIMAPHHQHIFSLRLDPMIDGQNNSVVETEVLPLEQVLPANSLASKDLDWAGNGFVSKKRTLLTTSEGPRDAKASTSRMWSFVNEEKVHHSTKQPVGYRIMCQNLPPLLARPDSFVARRAPFAAHSFWTAPYVDHQIFPSVAVLLLALHGWPLTYSSFADRAGKYVTQTRVAPEDSLEGWMKGDKNIANTDIVTWISMGVTHIPRSEGRFSHRLLNLNLRNSSRGSFFARFPRHACCKVLLNARAR